MTKKLLLQKLLLPILLICSSCGHGPYVTECISNPIKANLVCYDYEKSQSLTKLFSAVENWICLNPVDERNFLRACAERTDGPQVNVCIIDNANVQMSCFNQSTGLPNTIPMWKTENYVCLSGTDFNAVLNYCLRARAENLNP
jgi:hypothetical protein